MTVFRTMRMFIIFLILLLCPFLMAGEGMETKVTVDCQSDPENMVVQVETDVPFRGKVYVSHMHNDPKCSTRGKGSTMTRMKIPYKGCNTTEKKAGLFLTQITVQQHRLIVSAGDGNYEVGCKMFRGDIQVGSSSGMAVTKIPETAPVAATSSVAPPQVLLRIYDFENDVFLDTVRLGQVVELEITIRDGNIYQGRVSDCDAKSANGKVFPIIRNYCPVDLTISDRVYVDDQSKTTGDYYLYIPFRIFRFLDGSKVSFTCNVIICQDDCPSADCGDFMGMSYGRKKRAITSRSSDNHIFAVSNQVTVVDGAVNVPPPSPSTGAEERPKPETAAIMTADRNNSWSVGTVAMLSILLVSLAVNVLLIKAMKKKSSRKKIKHAKPHLHVVTGPPRTDLRLPVIYYSAAMQVQTNNRP